MGCCRIEPTRATTNMSITQITGIRLGVVVTSLDLQYWLTPPIVPLMTSPVLQLSNPHIEVVQIVISHLKISCHVIVGILLIVESI